MSEVKQGPVTCKCGNKGFKIMGKAEGNKETWSVFCIACEQYIATLEMVRVLQ